MALSSPTGPRCSRDQFRLCGRAYAIVMPPDEPKRERDKLCHDCARLPAPPDGDCASMVNWIIAEADKAGLLNRTRP